MFNLPNRFLCVVALGCGVFVWPACAQSDPGLVDLSPQRYVVPDLPQLDPQPLVPVPPNNDEASAAPVVLLYHWAEYDALFLSSLGLENAGMFRLGMGGGFGRVDGSKARQAPVWSGLMGGWTRGTQHWQYLDASGVGLTLGKTTAGLPAWGQSVALAGVGLSQTLPAGGLSVGGWDYRVAAGALDAPAARSLAEGDLAYGPMAGDASVRYALDSQTTLTSRLQGTEGLITWGLGGAYAMGQAGTWRLGMSTARQAQGIGLHSQLAYTLGLTPGLDVSWVHRRQGDAYADLSSVGRGGGCACIHDQWQLDLVAGQWGTFSGAFEQQIPEDGPLNQKIDLSHRVWLGPHLKMRLETSQNLISGDYGWEAGLSVLLW